MNCTFSTLYRIIQLELRGGFVLNTRLMEFCKDEHCTKYSEKFHSSYKYINVLGHPSFFYLKFCSLSLHSWHSVLHLCTRLSSRSNNNICKPHIGRKIIKWCVVKIFFPAILFEISGVCSIRDNEVLLT